MYNDISVLENHHPAFAFEVARNAEANIFEGLKIDQFSSIRKLIIQLVLATDISQHFQSLNKFKAKVTAGNLKFEEQSDRHLVLEMMIKLGDISNPTKPMDQSLKWSSLVMEEFFKQGDRERELGIPISQFMDRESTSIPKW